jgi:hypothetical protein
LDLCFGYHQLPLKEGDKVKTTFWGINFYGKDCLYQWKFLPFGLKNAHVEFQRVMDWVLEEFGFTKCYVDNIIFSNLTLKDHTHHLQEVLGRLKTITLNFIHASVVFSALRWNTWVA